VLHAKVIGVAVAASLAVLGGSRPIASPPAAYYLALGDSLAYGLQPDKVDAGLPPSGFHKGYVDLFAASLRKLDPGIRVVNYGCPGESTRTFVAGGCPWLGSHELHDPHRGTQLQATLAFLRAHPGKVGPITLTLGGNDAAAVADACRNDLACVEKRAPAELAALGKRLSSILARVRAAAPNAEIILTGPWNGDFRHPAQTDPLFRAFASTIAKAAAGARARYADLLPAFNPPGSAAHRKARLCALTFLCSRGDGHPTDAGYRAIAAAVWTASGY
jgi:lysophospholipase L1-like esterase